MILIIVLLSSAISAAVPDSASAAVALKKTAQWQMNAFGPAAAVDYGWENAPVFMGLMAGYRETGDTSFLNYATEWAAGAAWSPLGGTGTSNADNQACTQVYSEIFMLNPIDSNRYMIDKMIANFDYLKRSFSSGRQLWSWCDALFMAPPALARLGHIRNDSTDFSWLRRMFFDVRDCLYDSAEGLFYRDARFIYPAMTTANGRKIFWGRGNGWVFSGLARIIPYLPPADTAEYSALFRVMADAVVRRQLPNGLWSASLNDPASFPNPETSGSSFFCHGLAWGVNSGVLPYAPNAAAAARAWNGLLACVDASGRLGYVQNVGDRPAGAYESESYPFGAGAFLLAAGEVIRVRWIPDSTPPANVTGLSAQAVPDRVLLSWNPASDGQTGISGYEIYRGLTADSLKFLARSFSAAAADTVIGNGLMLYYAVKAVNGNGLLSAEFSPVQSVMLPVYAATDLRPGKDTLMGQTTTRMRAAVTFPDSSRDTTNAYVRFFSLDTHIAIATPDGRVTARDTVGVVRIVAMRGLSWLNDTCRITVVRSTIAFLKRFEFRCSASPWRAGWISENGSIYDSARGYGWTGCATPLETRCDRAGGELLGTFILVRGSACSTGAFRVDAPDGDYVVRIALGDASYPNEDLRVQYGTDAVARYSAPGNLGNSYSVCDDTVTVSGGAGASFLVRGAPNGKISYLILLSKQGIAMADVSDDGYPPVSAQNDAAAEGSDVSLEVRPNPFNPVAHIILKTNRNPSRVSIFDLSGKRVAMFTHAGQAVDWNASAYPSGMYVIRAEAGGKTLSARVVLLR